MAIEIVDNIMFVCALAYYIILAIVFIVRANEKTQLELKLAPVFSILLIPFTGLWLVNLVSQSDSARIITGLPVIVFLVYDYWYRLYTRKKPLHHPEKWPRELQVYVLLFMLGSIVLNGYVYIVSRLLGNIVLGFYFLHLFAFAYYQREHRKRQSVMDEFSE
jgi:predicted neutral ceramidase superfamily lipid hydrolase